MELYTDGRKKYFVRAGLSDEPAHNYKVFYCDADRTDGQGQHGYTGRGNPWTSERAAEINLDALAKKHGWRRF